MHDYGASVIRTVTDDGLVFIKPEYFNLSAQTIEAIKKSEELYYNHFQIEKPTEQQWDNKAQENFYEKLMFRIANDLKSVVGDATEVELYIDTSGRHKI